MAIKIADEYVNSTPPDADYPGGSFKDATTPASFDGTPLQKKWANDWLGFFQKLLVAGSVVASGVPDTVLASDYYTALVNIVGDVISSLSSSSATAGTLAQRYTDGRLLVGTPVVDGDAATKAYVDATVTVPVGVSQSWSQPARSTGVTYTNSNGRPIQVLISVQCNEGITSTFLINGVGVARASCTDGARPEYTTYSAIIPDGDTYRVNSGVINHWSELS